MNKSEQLIACLEGEIAKRDETIARLEPQLNRAIQANYDLREELAACRVSVENCDLIRARIAELEADRDSHQRCAIQAMAELSALKAQDPVAWVGAIEGGVPLLMVEPQNWKATPLYAAPVSEAKAQGVVQWPNADEIMQMAFEEGQPADDASGYCFELEEFDLFIERLMSDVARLNAVPVRQVSVPDGSRLVTTDWLKRIHRDLDACQKLIWANMRGCDPSYYEDAQERLREIDAMLAASPAAPAADAGLVAALETIINPIEAMRRELQVGEQLNGMVAMQLASDPEYLRGVAKAAIAAHRAKGVV